MITITRRLAATLKFVFRAALNLSTRGPFPPVSIEGGDDGYRIRCRTAAAIAEYQTTEETLTEKLTVPFTLLAECAANNDQPLTLEQTSEGIIARWQEAAIPQERRFDSLELPEEEWPERPALLAENPHELMSALNDACLVTDANSVRYALGCLQLSGEGLIAATDGRQLLVQLGYVFPWEGEVLLPATKLFGCKHLPQHEPVLIGKQEEWLTIRIGSWTFQLKLHLEGRFPKVDDMIRSAGEATASFELPPSDQEFLRQNLTRLPGSEEFNSPVTVDLNGTVAVRAKSADSDSITELVLRGATRTGEQTRFQSNRKFLGRAMELGFDRVHITNPNSPAYCLDERRYYLWALLESKDALKPTPDSIVIESPNSVRTSQRQERTSMTRTKDIHANEKPRHRATKNGPTHGEAVTTAVSSGEQLGSDLSAVDQAIALRNSLRTAANHVRSLVRSLKREQRQARAVRSTLLSLRQLQATDA